MTLREQVADRISGGRISEQKDRLKSHSQELSLLRESIQRLEQALYSPEWRQLSLEAEEEFTREGIRAIVRLSRLMRLKNPVIGRGVEVQRLYVWAQGVTIRAEDNDINEVVQSFLDDERNKAELTSHQARGEKERDLQQDGQIFLRLFVDKVSGRVRVRSVDCQEIDDIICNPEDAKEPWFYRRTYTQTSLEGTTKQKTEFYPDWRYHPKDKTQTLSGGDINWDTPIYHVGGNNPMGKWYLPEYYAALDWAMAYKKFLEQLATVWQALARWAFKLTTKGGRGAIAAAKAELGTTLSTGTDETNPPPVTGSIFLQDQSAGDLQPFRTSGATMSAEDGRRLLLMSIQVFGFPETFYGDVSVGTLATAKSLDRPTELKISDRQLLWTDVHLGLLDFVLRWAIEAPKGPLRGLGDVERIDDGDEIYLQVEWNTGVEPGVTMEFPPIVEQDLPAQVEATTKAYMDGKGIPAETTVRRLLTLLGVQDLDEVMEIWKEQEEERKEMAQQIMQQTGSEGEETEDGEEAEEETATEEALRLQMQAARGLLEAIDEAILEVEGRNGHPE